MRGCAGVFFALALAAQQPAPEEVVRGTLVGWDNAAVGDLSVRFSDNSVRCFRFDRATGVERDGLRAALAQLRKGDLIEIVPADGPNPRLRRAASIRVLASRPAAPRPHPRFQPDALDDIFPRGDLNLAGAIRQIGPDRMLLRTRTQGDVEILLREDTRYFGNGREDGYSGLRVNTRVFVRAGRNLADSIEAYRVVWGGILTPSPAEKAIPSARSPRESGATTAAPAGERNGSRLLY